MATTPPNLLGKLDVVLDALEHKLNTAFGAQGLDYVALSAATAKEYLAVAEPRTLLTRRHER